MPMLVRIIHDNGICRVPIANFPDKYVSLYEEDLEELLALGIDMHWKFSNGNVWVGSGNKRIAVARLICDADVGQQVFFLDRNPFNMLRENLVLAPGRAKYRARHKLEFSVHSANKLRREELIVEHDVR